MSFWDEWFKRFGDRSPFFTDIDHLMEEMEKEIAEVFKEMEGRMPREMYREKRLPDGTTRREYGPFVYGYSVKIGPDGKPIIREFGNMKPGLGGEGDAPLNLQERREPLVDLIEENASIKILAELPGVEKKDIQLYVTPHNLTITVDNPNRRFYKELELPVEVDESTAKSSYRNGVLETVIQKKKSQGKGSQIKIE